MLIAGLRSRHGAANAVLGLVARQVLIPLATVALFLEYEDVMRRPAQLEAMHLTEQGAERVLAALASAMEPVEVFFTWRPQLDDPGDELVLEAAVNGRAEAIITHSLRHFAAAAPRFGIAALHAADALRRITP